MTSWMRFTIALALALAAAAALFLTTSARADYPDKPIRVVVPAAPGGITDVAVRIIAERMKGLIGQPLTIDNRGGAGGLIGADIVKHAPPDGYTLFYSHAAALSFLPALMRNSPYNVREDFSAVVLCAKTPIAVVVRAQGPYKSVNDLINAARSNPKGISYGTAGVGNGSHIVGLLLAKETGARMEAIHYKGDGPAIADLIGGQLDFYTAGAVRQQVDSGRLRVLAVTGSERWFVFPEAPTFKELGMPNVEIYGFSGFLAPKGTSDAIVAKLNRAANDALQDPKVRDKLMGLGFQVMGGSPAEFAELIETETERIRKVGKNNNLVIE